MSRADGGPVSPVAREVVRLETVAEAVAATGVPAGEFAERYAQALAEQVAARDAVAVKSVAAYRCGLGLAPAPPAPAAVANAAGRWLSAGPTVAADDRGPGRPGGGFRLTDPVLVSMAVWVAVDLGLPIQLHVGYGDRDVTLHRADPSLLTPFLRAAPPGVPVLLLHCYPFHREASCLAAMFGQVYVDVGLTLNHVGPVRAAAVLAEALELTPFGKLLYSSDAFGLPELFALGARVFRRSLAEVLDARVDAGEWSARDAERLALAMAAGTANRVYGLGTGPATRTGVVR